MECPECSEEMKWQNGGDYGDFSYKFDEWMECNECGYVTEVPT